MLEVVFYQENLDLVKRMSEEKPPLIVCPSPQVADNLRSLAPDLEIITISKWVSNHLKRQGVTRVRKSELMIKLAAVWRHYYPDEGTSAFLEAFELFTELRSYTLNLDLLGQFLQELDENIRKSIHIFWLYTDQEKIIDEHLSYSKVTESKFNSDMCFVGFKHMSGVQIDMLKTLSEDHSIQVHFPESVYFESLPNDWIRWLAPIEDQKKVENKIIGDVSVAIIPKGKANIVLDQFFKKHPKFDLILAGTQIGLTAYQEAQRKNSFFKTNEDIFSVELDIITKELRELLKVKRVLTIDELSEYLEGVKKFSLAH
ncbi:MAG: hypothetical protein K2Q18_06235, partial [Bdellovibrionales bacterium]|nr:hypothetical protein [Bdellovibrionales bacterium]